MEHEKESKVEILFTGAQSREMKYNLVILTYIIWTILNFNIKPFFLHTVFETLTEITEW